MTSVLATIRPDSQNFPLFLHVFGAMILVGGTLTGASTLAFARNDPRFLRLGYWTLLIVALPGFILMRIGAEWIYNTEHWDDVPSPSQHLALARDVIYTHVKRLVEELKQDARRQIC